MTHDAVKYDEARRAMRRSFEVGVHGTPDYNTGVILNTLSELGLFEKPEQPTFELHDAIKGYQMLVMTMDDGTQQHMKIHSDWWVKGSPRPTSPGVYRHPKEPTTIYTLYSDGLWRSNRNFNGPIAERHIPDGLIKIA